MRRGGEQPERVDGAVPDPGARRAGGRLLVPLVVAGAAAVVLSTAVEGPASFTPFGSGGSGTTETAPAPAPTMPPAAPPGRLGPMVDSVAPTVLLVIAGVIGAVVAVLLIRLLVIALRDRRRRSGSRTVLADDAGTGPAVADAPTVLRGIAAALVAIDGHREPSDAVVQAWLGLQQAAEDAGLGRSPAETPTEFTGRVLSRTGTDRVALRTLLRLYLRARFGDGEITAADTVAARQALQALEASWERATAGNRA